MEEVVRATLGLRRKELDAAGIAVSLTAPEGLPRAVADPQVWVATAAD